jgi:lysozyme
MSFSRGNIFAKIPGFCSNHDPAIFDTFITGIDVSHHNGFVDWPGAAALGVTFAFAKATEGGDPSHASYTDRTFANNWQAMWDAGVVRGAYHLVGLPLATTARSQWNGDLHRQIDHFLDTVGPLAPGDLPPVLDLENGDSPGLWRSLIQSDRGAALAIVRELILYTTHQIRPAKPILYTGSFWWSDLGDPDPAIDNMPFGDYPLWFAQYPKVQAPAPLPGSPGANGQGQASGFKDYLGAQCPRHIPKIWGGLANPRWDIWQFSSFGKLAPAVTGFVDLNVFHGNLQQLKALAISPAAAKHK